MRNISSFLYLISRQKQLCLGIAHPPPPPLLRTSRIWCKVDLKGNLLSLREDLVLSYWDFQSLWWISSVGLNVVYTDAVERKGEEAKQASAGAAFSLVLAEDSFWLPGEVEFQAEDVFAFATRGKVSNELSGQTFPTTCHDLLSVCLQLQKLQGLPGDPKG